MARLKSRLTTIANASDAALSLALSDTAKLILLLVRVYAPKATGWLRDSYEEQKVAHLTVLIGTMVNYAVFQEYGTYKIAAQPHLTPAMKLSEPIFKTRLIRAVKELD